MSESLRRASCALAVGVLFAAAPAAAEPQVGNVSQQEFLGAMGTRVGGGAEQLHFARQVYADETVDTGPTAKTSLVFLDATNLMVGSNSRVVLDKFVYDPSQRLGEAAIDFSAGAFRWITGNIRNKEAVTLRTPTATISIRGTELLVFVLEDGSSEINVVSGAVDVVACNAGAAIPLAAGQRLMVTAACGTAIGVARQVAEAIPDMPADLALGDIAPAAGPAPSSTASSDGGGNNGDNRPRGPRDHDGFDHEAGGGSTGGGSTTGGGGSTTGGGQTGGGSTTSGGGSTTGGGSTSSGQTGGGSTAGGGQTGGSTSDTAGGTKGGGSTSDSTGGCGGNCT